MTTTAVVVEVHTDELKWLSLFGKVDVFFFFVDMLPTLYSSIIYSNLTYEYSYPKKVRKSKEKNYVEKIRPRERQYCMRLGPKKGQKALNLSLFAAVFSNLDERACSCIQ